MSEKSDESGFAMSEVGSVKLIDTLFEKLAKHKKLLEMPNLKESEKVTIVLSLSGVCFDFGEAFGEQHKIHLTNALKELEDK